MTSISKVVGRTVDILLSNQKAKTATSYISENFVVRATQRRHQGRSRTIDVVLTIGKPNYRSREYIKALQRAGESFPVRKIHLTLAK